MIVTLLVCQEIERMPKANQGIISDIKPQVGVTMSQAHGVSVPLPQVPTTAAASHQAHGARPAGSGRLSGRASPMGSRPVSREASSSPKGRPSRPASSAAATRIGGERAQDRQAAAERSSRPGSGQHSPLQSPLTDRSRGSQAGSSRPQTGASEGGGREARHVRLLRQARRNDLQVWS